MSTNNITIVGRLAKDPELRFASTGTAMCTVVIPDQKQRKGEDGQWRDESATTWVRATVFKDAAEALAEVARKGDEVIATGRLITREWTTKEGETRSGLELDFAKVAVVPRAPRGDRFTAGAPAQQPAADPWATKPATQQQPYDKPPF